MRELFPGADQGICATIAGDWWFPQKGESTKPAKRVCAGCPVQTACREHGILHERLGIWGGLSERQLRDERKRRGLPQPDLIDVAAIVAAS